MDRLKKERLKVYYGGLRPWTRHSLVLLVAGFAYLGIGLAYFLAPAPPERRAALEVVVDLMSLHYWGIVFMAVGILTVISARYPPRYEKWGYSALTGLSAAWGSGYLLSMIFGDSPILNATGALIWLLVGFMWWAISGLVNPAKTVVVPDGRS